MRDRCRLDRLCSNRCVRSTGVKGGCNREKKRVHSTVHLRLIRMICLPLYYCYFECWDGDTLMNSRDNAPIILSR